MLICMRTTLNLDDDLLAEAQRTTGVKEKTRLLHLGLQALIQRESGQQTGASPQRRRVQLPVATARGGLAKGHHSLAEAVKFAESESDRRQARLA
jgi:Arc/MetJ family transcription regulator